MTVLAIIGRLLTKPWMKLFYNKASDGLSNLDAFEIIEKVVSKIIYFKNNPAETLTTSHDMFGNDLP